MNRYRFLFVSLPAFGHMDLGGARRTAEVLKRRGYPVGWASGNPLASFIRSRGFDFFPVAPHVEVAEICEVTRPLAGLERSQFIIENFFLNSTLLEASVEELITACETFQPTILCTEPFHFSTAIVAELLNLPWCSYGTKGVPENYSPDLQAQWDRGTLQLNQLRQRYRLPPIDVRTGNISPYLCIYFSAPDFELSNQELLPPQAHLIGAPLCGQAIHTQPPVQIIKFLAKRPPRIFVTLGTVFRDFDLLELFLNALGGMDVAALISIGPQTKHIPSSLPSNIHLIEYVDHEFIIPYVDAVICHGGYSTTKDALSCGVPIIAIPLGSDNPTNAQRIWNSNAGLVLSRSDLSAKKIRHALGTLLSDSIYRKRAREMKDRFAENGTVETAADLLVALARAKRPIIHQKFFTE